MSANQDRAEQSTATRSVVERFFNGFTTSNMEAVFDAFDAAVEYTVNTRNSVTREAIPWSKTYHGTVEVRAFFGRLMQNFDVLAFYLEEVIAEGDAAAAFGFFRYRVKATGLECSTDWCARFRVGNGQITHYQFFEDSYAIARAFRVGGQWELALDEGTQCVPPS